MAPAAPINKLSIEFVPKSPPLALVDDVDAAEAELEDLVGERAPFGSGVCEPGVRGGRLT